MGSSVELYKKYSNRVSTIIETGTFAGEGIGRAIESGFKKIYSCDINPQYVENAKIKYIDKNVIVENSESRLFLKKILPNIQERIIIFLDAHSMPHDMNNKNLGFGEDTIKEGVSPCPLIDELEEIKNHPIKNHFILIDDFQCFGTWMFEGLQVNTINNLILSINKDYKPRLFNNVLCYEAP